MWSSHARLSFENTFCKFFVGYNALHHTWLSQEISIKERIDRIMATLYSFAEVIKDNSV
jgi:hypothetical protein